MPPLRHPLIPIVLATLGLALDAQAAVLASYNFEPSPGSVLTATTAAVNVTAGSFSQAPAAGASIGISAAGNIFQRSTNTSNSAAGALANAEYHTVTISAASGYVLNLTSVTFFLGHTTDNATSFTSTAVLSASADSFATAIAGSGGTSRTTAATTSSAFNATAATYDLSAAAYQNLSSITFRLAAFDNLNENGKISRFDDFTLNGSVVAIPESSTALLGGLGLLTLLRRRRPAV